MGHTVLTEKFVHGLGKPCWNLSYWRNMGQGLKRKKVKIKLKCTIVLFLHSLHVQNALVTSINVNVSNVQTVSVYCKGISK